MRGAKERRRKVLSASDAGDYVNFFDQSDKFEARKNWGRDKDGWEGGG